MIIVTPIKPKAYRRQAIRDEILKEGARIGKDMSKSMREDVATWKHKPTFPVKVSSTTKKLVIDVTASGPNARIYEYVDQGTRAHNIFPRRAGGALRFKWGGPGSYSPKTEPGRGGATRAYQSGKIVFFKKVRHPGIKARRFGRNVARLWEAQIPRRLQEAINRGIKLSGHAYYERFGI